MEYYYLAELSNGRIRTLGVCFNENLPVMGGKINFFDEGERIGEYRVKDIEYSMMRTEESIQANKIIKLDPPYVILERIKSPLEKVYEERGV